MTFEEQLKASTEERLRKKQEKAKAKKEAEDNGEAVEDEGDRIDRERKEKKEAEQKADQKAEQKEDQETEPRDAIRSRRAALPKLPISLTASLLANLDHFTMSDIHLHIASLGWQREITFGAFMQTFNGARTSARPGNRSSSSSSAAAVGGAHAALATHLFALFYYAPEMDDRFKQEAERRLLPTRCTLLDVLEVEVRMRFHE